jgi:hypothetical protein
MALSHQQLASKKYLVKKVSSGHLENHIPNFSDENWKKITRVLDRIPKEAFPAIPDFAYVKNMKNRTTSIGINHLLAQRVAPRGF